jgi:hypothetical protein
MQSRVFQGHLDRRGVELETQIIICSFIIVTISKYNLLDIATSDSLTDDCVMPGQIQVRYGMTVTYSEMLKKCTMDIITQTARERWLHNHSGWGHPYKTSPVRTCPCVALRVVLSRDVSGSIRGRGELRATVTAATWRNYLLQTTASEFIGSIRPRFRQMRDRRICLCHKRKVNKTLGSHVIVLLFESGNWWNYNEATWNV